MTRALNEVTDLLDAWSDGDPAALDQLIPLVYDELYRIASRQFRNERQGHTLQPTAVVHETYLRFKGQRKVQWRSRSEFFAVAARQIRRILVDHERRKRRLKRGSKVPRISLDEAIGVEATVAPGYLALDEALRKLAELAPRQSRVVELRIFGGLTVEETAEVLGIGRATVHRDWNAAQLWLRRALSSG